MIFKLSNCCLMLFIVSSDSLRKTCSVLRDSTIALVLFNSFISPKVPFTVDRNPSKLSSKIIRADEPTANLDTKTGIDVFNLLTLLSREFKRTIILVTHNPELAAATDRAMHIRDGAIEKDVINVKC
ncbi:MAG: hypothetical protein WA323_08640 [Candidatus Nitrosopolaris sp.]